MNQTFIINNVEYSKEEINKDEDLKEKLLSQLKKEHHKIMSRESARKFRQVHKDKIKEYNREYQRKKYHENEEYRKRRLESQKLYIERSGIVRSGMKGRPKKYVLDDELNLITIKE